MARESGDNRLAGGPASSVSVISRQTCVEGTITGTAAVRVEGVLKGSVRLDAALEVAEGATVEAEVHASVVRVAGNVIGDVRATELVELLASASVKGDVAAPALHVVEGATLEGRVEMQSALEPGRETPKSR